jgi:hypothetical protein
LFGNRMAVAANTRRSNLPLQVWRAVYVSYVMCWKHLSTNSVPMTTLEYYWY